MSMGILHSTSIPVADGRGYIKISDVKVGDMVFDEAGYPSEVTDIKSEKGDVISVAFSDKTSLLCGLEQTFASRTRSQHYNHDAYGVRDLGDMSSAGLFAKSNSNNKTSIVKAWYVPVAQGLIRDDVEFDLDPYLLGFFIGDGTFDDKYFAVKTKQQDIVKYISELLHADSYNLVKVRDERHKSWHFLKNGDYIIRDRVDKNGILTKDRIIPSEYLYGSIDQRFALLQGLMDSEGSVSANDRLCCKYITSHEHLAESVMILATSLGLRVTKSVQNRSSKHGANYKNEIAVYFAVSDQTKSQLFLSNENLDKINKYMRGVKKFNRLYDDLSICDVMPVSDRDNLISLQVDSVSNCYQVTDRHLVVYGHIKK